MPLKSLADDLNITSVGLGIDIEENSRFSEYSPGKDDVFLNKIFTLTELKYCFSKTNPAQHLCARFAAKEAAIKALKSLGFSRATYKDIEIINDQSGRPILKIKKAFNSTGQVSLSHSRQNSAAAVLIKKNHG